MTPESAAPRRFAWAHTLGAVAVFVLAQLLAVPGTSDLVERAGAEPLRSSWLSGLANWAPPTVPLLPSGLVPWLAFGWLVAGLLLSADATERARAIARRVVLGLLLVFAAIQGWAISLWLEASSMDYEPSLRSRLVITVAFVAGAALLWVCSRWIDARGSGQGPLVLLLVHSSIEGASLLGQVGTWLGTGQLSPLVSLIELGSLVPVVVVALALALRSPRAWPVPVVRSVQLGSGLDLLGAYTLGTTIVGAPVVALATRAPGGSPLATTLHTAIGLGVAVALVLLVARRSQPRRRLGWLALVGVLPLAGVGWLALSAIGSAGGLPSFARPGPFDGDGRFAIVLERAQPDTRQDRAHEVAVRDARNLERRLADLGVTAHVAPSRAGIELELRDVGSPQQLLDAVLPPNQLAFRLIASDQSSLDHVELGPSLRRESDFYAGSRIVGPTREALDEALRGFTPPAGLDLLYECGEGRGGSETECSPYLLEPAVLTNADVADATVATDPQVGRPYVALEFTTHGARTLETVTAASIHRKLAIVADGKIISSPVIQSAIPGGRAQITLGSGSPIEMAQQAQSLAVALRVGPLEARWQLASLDALASE